MGDQTTPAIVGMQHGQWYAVSPHYCVAGTGMTRPEALSDLASLLNCYLRSFTTEERAGGLALRPLSPFDRLRLFLPLKRRSRVLVPMVMGGDPGGTEGENARG